MKKLLARLFGKKRKQSPVEHNPMLDFYDKELLEMACADSSRLKEIPPKKYNGETVEWRPYTPLGQDKTTTEKENGNESQNT